MKYIEISKTLFREFKNFVKDTLLNNPKCLTNSEQKKVIINEIKEKGFFVIPNYLGKEQCDSIINFIDYTIDENPNLWQDDVKSDTRIFFSNLVNKQLADFLSDAFVLDVLGRYEKSNKMNGFTLANKLDFKENNPGSGGGWHRDLVTRKQTKALLYLSNVDIDNGPFQYIEESNKLTNIIRLQATCDFSYGKNRFSEKEVDRIITNSGLSVKTFIAEQGTLLLSDTRGIHRGSPIKRGNRYMATNYYFFHSSIPRHLRELNPFSQETIK